MLFLIIQVHGFVGAILNHQLYGVCGLDDSFFDFLAILRGKMAEDVGSQVVILRFFAYADAEVERLVANGNAIAADKLVLCERRRATTSAEFCACTAGVRESCELPADAEIIAVIAENKLRALYAYDEAHRVFRSRCVFQTGVSRGVAY